MTMTWRLPRPPDTVSLADENFCVVRGPLNPAQAATTALIGERK